MLFLFIGCQSSQIDFNNSYGSGQSAEIAIDTLPDISGLWNYRHHNVLIDRPDLSDPNEPLKEWTYFYSPPTSDLFFRADSFYLVDYPLQLIEQGKYNIDSITLNMDGRIATSKFSIEADTLKVYFMEEENFVELVYERAQVNDSIISILKRDSIDYALLAGPWYVEREFSYGNDGSYYLLEYDHEIPDSIFLTREDILSTLNTDRSFEMLSDGIKRKYTYSFHNGEGNNIRGLNLTPTEWYKGEKIKLEYSRPGSYYSIIE